MQDNLHRPASSVNQRILLVNRFTARCPCWWRLAHLDQGEDIRVLLDGVTCTISIPSTVNADDSTTSYEITSTVACYDASPDSHSRYLPLLINILPFYDEICKRSAAFILSCSQANSLPVRDIARDVIYTRRCSSVLGRNALYWCS